MFRKMVYGLVAAAALGTACGSTAVSAAGPGFPGALPAVGPNVELASFWGEPYPYGYAWRHGCVRHVKVETPYGWRWRRVWVCR
jgi:hypothetical protein